MPVIPIYLLVQVVTIVVSPRGLATLQAGLGVTLLLKQLLELLLVLDGGAEPDLLVLAAATGSADSDVQVFRSQTRDDLQHGMHAAAQVGRDIGAEDVRPTTMIQWRRLVHLEEQCLDGDVHLSIADALDQIV